MALALGDGHFSSSPQPRRRVEGLSERAAPPASQMRNPASRTLCCHPALQPDHLLLPSFTSPDITNSPSTLVAARPGRQVERSAKGTGTGTGTHLDPRTATVASDPSSASVGAVAIQDGLSDSKDDLLRIDKRLPHSSKIYTCNPKLITIVDCGLALRERGEHLPVDDSLGPTHQFGCRDVH
ncbi:hypothetical protein L207DRAFT_584284 [Hyaloscypha variabilis F]|uniref:Uncharacterized protein n=1 Tax=Hyaloscypha variabilis (strain UAMH 11265 / GT02V1 / F) TaxID=1149755 RepID=A0A2J6RK30_HYAVF|nr:hypothetical protein L207DRAFT_584284 [Hyaloscypha variabilis F]